MASLVAAPRVPNGIHSQEQVTYFKHVIVAHKPINIPVKTKKEYIGQKGLQPMRIMPLILFTYIFFNRIFSSAKPMLISLQQKCVTSAEGYHDVYGKY